jgi:hypothetical protein
LRAGQGNEKEIDLLIDNFWDELLKTMGNGRGIKAADGMIDEKKLQAMLKRILETLSAESSASPTVQEPVFENLEGPSDFEDLEELSRVEDFEEFDQVEIPAEISAELLAAAGTEGQEEPSEEFEDLEELEELEPLEEVEELEPADEIEPVAEDVFPPAQDIDDAASKIEFSPLPELEEDIPETEEDLEIVSPFADIFSDFSKGGEEKEKQAAEEEPSGENAQKAPKAKINNPNTGLEELKNHFNMPLMHKLLLFENTLNPEYLETLQDSPPDPAEEVIEERDGLPFINQASLHAPEDAAGDISDKEFKDLVDSVLK